MTKAGLIEDIPELLRAREEDKRLAVLHVEQLRADQERIRLENERKEAQRKARVDQSRTYLSLYRTAGDKKCDTAVAVAWARDHAIAARSMGELRAVEWRELRQSAPSREAVTFLEAFASGKVDPALVKDALDQTRETEDAAEAAMEKDAARLIGMCEVELEKIRAEVEADVH